MGQLFLDGDDLVLRMSGWERAGAVLMGPELRFPRSSIGAITTCAPAFAGVRGIRIVGTGIPGTVALGRRRVSGCWEYVVVHGRDPGSVLVDLVDQKISRLVVSAPDPAAMAAAIR